MRVVSGCAAVRELLVFVPVAIGGESLRVAMDVPCMVCFSWLLLVYIPYTPYIFYVIERMYTKRSLKTDDSHLSL